MALIIKRLAMDLLVHNNQRQLHNTELHTVVLGIHTLAFQWGYVCGLESRIKEGDNVNYESVE